MYSETSFCSSISIRVFCATSKNSATYDIYNCSRVQSSKITIFLQDISNGLYFVAIYCQCDALGIGGSKVCELETRLVLGEKEVDGN